MAHSVRPGEFEGTLERAAAPEGAFDVRAFAVRPQGQHIDTHTHAEAHLMLVLAGAYISTARGAPDYARPPFLVFDPPGTTHRDRFADSAGAFVSVTLTAQALATARAAGGLPEMATVLDRPAAMAAAVRVAREMPGAVRDAAVVEAAAWELIGAVAEDQPGRSTPGWAHLAFEAVMDDAAEADLSVADIARAVGVHPVHLARVFRQAWGCSPGELMRWRRVERACDLLRDTAWPAAEIAAAVGFVDQSHMTRAFRAVTGLPPGGWRRARHVAPIQDGKAWAA
ncbi:MAG: hypothetical protein JWP49_367 [Phenylobacterium sp.]|nr:hypothetical protein [Phenylobacterium sp.]